MTARIVKTILTTITIVVGWLIGGLVFAALTSWMPTWLLFVVFVVIVAAFSWHSYRPKTKPDLPTSSNG